MTPNLPESPSAQALSRRSVLGGGTAALLAAVAVYAESSASATSATAAPADVARQGNRTGRHTFAFFTDPHADPENIAQQARLQATLKAIAADDPELVLHAGDVTEYGTDAEYQSYLDLVPAEPRNRIQHVPGNHEIRWDVSAYGNYADHVGELNAEVTVGGAPLVR
ncbi:metallophosphoesterase family protein [Citricoccus sp. GCM10030269]|uniref:metallophosphoesterase family protein n=1 Tax=Citricoccus sp. GCM10030269 TaxID=3273388 RepID=UPI0036096236